MLTRLPESRRPRQRKAGSAVLSAMVHAGLIAYAVAATHTLAEPRQPQRVHWDTLVYVAPRAPAPAAPSHAPPSTRTHGPTVPSVPTIDVPEIVPVGIPPIDVAHAIDVDSAFAHGARLSSARGDGPRSGSNGSGETISTGVFTERTVERAVVARPDTRPPRYPSPLQSAGIEGAVTMRFVVDTTGRVELGTVQVVHSDHALFERAVRDALAAARYIPAEVGARRVRQLVEQAFEFRIGR
jgi:periplasmic protein TonB